MNKNRMLLVVVILFVVLMVGAYFLYDELSDDVERKVLSEQTEVDTNIEETEKDSADTESETENQEEDSQKENEDDAKTQAPDFTVYDIEGNPVKLSDFIGKPTIVNFWASWCGPCKREMPDFEAAYQEQGEKIHFLIVNMTDDYRETVETASSYVEEQGFTFPVYYDTDYSASTTYGVSSIPTTYFLDAEGCIVAYATGMIDAETIQRGIDMIMGE